MIPFTLSEIAPILNAQWIGQNRVIHTVSISSSNVAHDCLFIALKGKNCDGHSFISQAVFMGACALLVDRYIRLDVPQLVVKNTRLAIAQLGFWVRTQVSSKVIAVTGSSGKTSVKEMTATILSCQGKVIATYENYNNEIGVPLTLLRLTGKEDFIVIEIGASNFRELLSISSLVRPDVVLINNIFPAHLSGFESLIGVAEAKGEIFSSVSVNGICVLNVDNHAWPLWKNLLVSKTILTFSMQKKDGVDFFATNIICCHDHVRFNLHMPYGVSPIVLSMLGYHSISNALAASALAFSVGARLEEIVLGLRKIRALSGRLFPVILGPGKLLLDDSYNANVGSMLAGIHVLRKSKGYRVIVVGDMAELGDYTSLKYHRDIGEFIATTNINIVLSFGYLSYLISYYSGRGEHFHTKNMLLIRLMQLFDRHEIITVLIKSSRNVYMDSLVVELKEKLYDYLVI